MTDSQEIPLNYNPAVGFPGGASGKEPDCQCRRHERHGFHPWVRKIPWRMAWLPTHGQRFITLYRRQGARPSPRKRNAKKQNGSEEALQIALKRREAKRKMVI